MIHRNYIISLIKQTQKVKSSLTILSSMYTKFCLYANSSRSLVTNNSNIVEDNNVNNDEDRITENISKEIKKDNVIKDTKINISSDRKENMSIYNYVNNINPELAEICPKQYMKINTNKDDVHYLMDKNTAKILTRLMINDLYKDMNFVAETNPGTGLLIEELLNAGIKKIYAYEINDCFYPALNKLQDKYPDRLEIRNANLFKMSKLYYLDLQDNEERINKVLHGFNDVPWENESTCMQVIGMTKNFLFFKHLILSTIFRTSFMKFGRTSFYLTLSPSIWNVLNNPNNRATKHFYYVIFHTLFDFKHLGNVPRISYIPWQKSSIKKFLINDHETLKFVKIEPKANLFNNYLKLEEIIPYWYFLKYHLRSSEQRVIPELEKWVPGSGVRLIRMDYNIFTRFIDLTPTEFFNLYKEFISWPEFKSCLFLSSAHSYIQFYSKYNISIDNNPPELENNSLINQ